MNKNKVIAFKKPEDISGDPLTELLRTGAQRLIADAVEVIRGVQFKDGERVDSLKEGEVNRAVV